MFVYTNAYYLPFGERNESEVYLKLASECERE